MVNLTNFKNDKNSCRWSALKQDKQRARRQKLILMSGQIMKTCTIVKSSWHHQLAGKQSGNT